MHTHRMVMHISSKVIYLLLLLRCKVSPTMPCFCISEFLLKTLKTISSIFACLKTDICGTELIACCKLISYTRNGVVLP